MITCASPRRSADYWHSHSAGRGQGFQFRLLDLKRGMRDQAERDNRLDRLAKRGLQGRVHGRNYHDLAADLHRCNRRRGQRRQKYNFAAASLVERVDEAGADVATASPPPTERPTTASRSFARPVRLNAGVCLRCR